MSHVGGSPVAELIFFMILGSVVASIVTGDYGFLPLVLAGIASGLWATKYIR
jgi:hypothetical protein